MSRSFVLAGWHHGRMAQHGIAVVGDDLEATYHVRLRAVQWASSLLRQLSHSSDREAVSIAAHWALNAVYDLSEVYWPLVAPEVVKNPGKSIGGQLGRTDHLAQSQAGEKVSALLIARGKATHELSLVSELSSFRELPYEFAKLTDWAWAQPTWKENEHLKRQTKWFSTHIAGRALWVPIDAAYYWFADRGPEFLTGESLTGAVDWVSDLALVFHSVEER